MPPGSAPAAPGRRRSAPAAARPRSPRRSRPGARRRSSRRGSARRWRSRSRPRRAAMPTRRRTSAPTATASSTATNISVGWPTLPADEAGRDRRRQRRPGRAGDDRHAQHDHHVEPQRQAGAERRRDEVDDQAEQAGGQRQRQLARRLRRRSATPTQATSAAVLGTRPSAAVSSVSWTGLLRKSFMPAARHCWRSSSSACAVSAMIHGAGAGPRLDAAGRLEAVELGHLDVHEDHVVGAGARPLPRRAARSRRRRRW